MGRRLRTAASPTPDARASGAPSTARPGARHASTARIAAAFPSFPSQPFVPAAAQVPMRIVDIREAVVPISSPLRNAYIDFSKMTASVVAVVTDVVRDGKPVVGYGRSEEHTSELQSLMRTSYAVFCLKKKNHTHHHTTQATHYNTN